MTKMIDTGLHQSADSLPAMLAAVLDAFPDGVLLFGGDGRLSLVNARFDAVWPVSAERFEAGMSIDRVLAVVIRYACLDRCDAGAIEAFGPNAPAQGNDVVQVQLDVAGQSLVCRKSETSAGGTMLTFSRDERPGDAQPAARERSRMELIEDLLDAVGHQMPGLVGQIDRYGRYVYANDAYADWYGVPVEHIIGATDEEFLDMTPGWFADSRSREERRVDIRDALSGRMIEFEKQRTFPDGLDRHIRGALMPSTDDNGKVRGVSIVTIDTSEEKRREQAYRESEERYRSLVELSPNYIMVHRDGECLFANPATDAIYGVPSGGTMVGQQMLMMIQPDSRSTIIDRYNALMGGAGPLEPTEVKGRRLDGSEFCLENRVATIHWDGKPAMLVVGSDISDRKKAEQQIRDRERLFRGLVDVSFDAVIISEQGKVIDFNAEALELFGYAGSELRGLNVLELVAPERHAFTRRKIEQQVSASYESVHRSKDGREFPVEVSATTLTQDGRNVRIVAIRDLTQRKRAEEELRQSEERYRRLAHLLPDAVRVVSDNKMVFANEAAAQLLEADTPDDIIGLPALHFSDPADFDDLILRMTKVDSGEPVTWREQELHGLKGGTVTVESTAAPIIWRGKPSRLVVNRDTTRYKEVENKLRYAVEEAKQANVAKSRFLAAASHDLRQPIQALGLLNAAMAYEVQEPNLKEINTNMSHAIDAMRSVLDGLLDISKLEAGVVKPAFTVFPISPLMDRIAAEFLYEADAKGLDLRVVASSANVRSDRDLIERILQNFVANAIRYTRYGRVLMGCRRRGDEIDVQVWDTGPGISEDNTERIFEEFVQLDNPQRDRSKGLGLGLAIVDRLSKLLAHPIEVRSHPDKGSMFSIVLPIDDPSGAPTDDLVSFPSIELDGKRILILDDDKEVVRATKSLLSRWGADVAGAHTSEEAFRLATADGERPDLVIVDYVLADGETGTDVIGRLDDALGARIPRIVISGDVSTRIHAEVRSTGAVLLHKPVDPAKLRSLIQHLLMSTA